GQPELRRVEAGPLLHGRAYEGGQDVPAVRAPDQPARLQPRAIELLPGLPALGVVTGAGQVAGDAPQQPPRGDRYLVDGLLECSLMAAGRFRELDHLANVLTHGIAALHVRSDYV